MAVMHAQKRSTSGGFSLLTVKFSIKDFHC